MDRLEGSPILMLITDIDSTLVDPDEPEDNSLLRFNALWESHYRSDSLLVFSTGGSPESYRLLRANKPLLTPDILVTSVGTEIFHGESMLSDSGWDELLARGWDRDAVVQEASCFPELVLQPKIDQRPYKVSFFVGNDETSKTVNDLSERLRKRGLDAKIVYGSSTALHILPQAAGKGPALQYLLDKFTRAEKQPLHTLFCGDSVSSTELFGNTRVYGVAVSRSLKEVLEWNAENDKHSQRVLLAEERCAVGIMRAIGWFGFGPHTSPRDFRNLKKCRPLIVPPCYEVVAFYLFYERWRRAKVPKSEFHLQNLISDLNSLENFIHPSGTEWSAHQCIEAMERRHGDQKGKDFKVWVDRVSSVQLGDNKWLVKCDKWESFGEDRCCCLTTIILSSKAEEPNMYTWLRIQQTWLAGSPVKDPDAWLL